MPDTWLDDLIRADTGARQITHADLKGFPEPVLSLEQHDRYAVLNAEIGQLMLKLQSRKRADVAAREATLARLEDVRQRRDAAFGQR